MNGQPTTPHLGATALPPAPPHLNREPPVRLARVLCSLPIGVVVTDICFWHLDGTPGLSVGVFFAALAILVLCNRESLPKRRTGYILLALLLGACLAAAVETCVTNTLVFLMLIVALAGDTYFTDVESAWGRWLSQGVALEAAPGRIFWLSARLLEAVFSGKMSRAGGLVGGCLLAIPALVLAVIFGSLLAAGNAVFGSWTNSFFDWFWKELALCLDPLRIFFWCFAAFLILPLLRPAQISEIWWKWTEQLPRLPEMLPARAEIFSSGLILFVLNLLFLVANAADAIFLWSGQALPPGVDPKVYVHEGVNALIATVLLSAVVLTSIFQLSLKVATRKELKFLAYAWIVQNLFLIVSVAEKVRRYIVFYQMTVARLSVIIFLVLVCVGFILLAVKIVRDRSISWLIGGCVLATFATFYIAQFLDLTGWSANYNVARMEKDPSRGFDVYTMTREGADIWPALRRAHELAPNNGQISAAYQQAFKGADYNDASGRDWKHWREFSLRTYMNREVLDDKK